MRIFSPKGARVTVGSRTFTFAPNTITDVPDEQAQYLLSTRRFFLEGEIPPSDVVAYKRPLKIGVFRIGGVGDALLGSCVIRAIHRLFPEAIIAAHTYSTIYKYWQGHPDIKYFQTSTPSRIGNRHNVPNYDIFYDLMPDCHVQYNTPEIPAPLLKQKAYFEQKINHYKATTLPNHLKPLCAEGNWEALDIYNQLYGTDAKLSDMHFAQSPKDRDCFANARFRIIPFKYITIHDWAFNGPQTKSWIPEYWENLVALVRKRWNLPIVQIGGIEETELPGTIDLRGKTTWGESVEILKHSLFHLDNESTPAHVCASTGTPCVVMCGPTMKYWRHKVNLNIESPYHCQQCEGTNTWSHVCNDKESRGCMRSLTPELVWKTFTNNADFMARVEARMKK